MIAETAAHGDHRVPGADRGRAQDALALASRRHAADRRQREPFTNHLLPEEPLFLPLSYDEVTPAHATLKPSSP
jgi:hypothetical protein